MTDLHAACERGDLKVVELAIDAGTNFEIYDSLGRSPLRIAIEMNHQTIVTAILKMPIVVNDKDVEAAMKNRNDDIITAVIETCYKQQKYAITDVFVPEKDRPAIRNDGRIVVFANEYSDFRACAREGRCVLCTCIYISLFYMNSRSLDLLLNHLTNCLFYGDLKKRMTRFLIHLLSFAKPGDRVTSPITDIGKCVILLIERGADPLRVIKLNIIGRDRIAYYTPVHIAVKMGVVCADDIVEMCHMSVLPDKEVRAYSILNASVSAFVLGSVDVFESLLKISLPDLSRDDFHNKRIRSMTYMCMLKYMSREELTPSHFYMMDVASTVLFDPHAPFIIHYDTVTLIGYMNGVMQNPTPENNYERLKAIVQHLSSFHERSTLFDLVLTRIRFQGD